MSFRSICALQGTRTGLGTRLWGQLDVPNGVFPEWFYFLLVIIPKGICSERSLFQTHLSMEVHKSESFLFR